MDLGTYHGVPAPMLAVVKAMPVETVTRPIRRSHLRVIHRHVALASVRVMVALCGDLDGRAAGSTPKPMPEPLTAAGNSRLHCRRWHVVKAWPLHEMVSAGA